MQVGYRILCDITVFGTSTYDRTSFPVCLFTNSYLLCWASLFDGLASLGGGRERQATCFAKLEHYDTSYVLRPYAFHTLT